MRSRFLMILGILVALLVIFGIWYSQKETTLVTAPEGGPMSNPSPTTSSSPLPSPEGSPMPSPSPTTPPAAGLDLTMDANGLSKATVVMGTTQGVIKYKFYPGDAPKTVTRIAELIGKGFYNGLIFHRVVPGFVIQGGDPLGTGIGGSGKKLDAEFNKRRHIEGAVAMARAADPNSADSQFYISLGVHPHLDNNYTVFGQVIEGMDVAKKIKVGDKITSIRIE